MSDVDNENAELPEQPRPAAAEPEPPVPAIEPEAARPRRVGLGLPIAALIVPVLGGCILFFVAAKVPSWVVSGGTVVISALLLAIDARRLGNIDLKGKRREPATVWLLGICLMWIVGYPYTLLFLATCLLWFFVYPFTFFRRREFGGPNLVIPAILVALLFVGSPFLRAKLIPATLPACDSREAVQLLDRVVRQSLSGGQVQSIDGHREVSYDEVADRRRGQCVVHTDKGNLVINYIVRWRDRDKAVFEVLIPPPDLPSCTDPKVVQLLERTLRATPIGPKIRSVDGHRQVRYDEATDSRRGQCVVHTENGEAVVNYMVRWRDRDKRRFEVGIVPAEKAENQAEKAENQGEIQRGKDGLPLERPDVSPALPLFP